MESQECVTPESRVCKDCGEEKPIASFYPKGKSRPGQFFTSCKECCKAREKANYPKFREVKLARGAVRRSEKKGEIKQYMANYYLKNRGRVLSRCKEYRANPDVRAKELARQKMYYAARSAEIQDKRRSKFTDERRDKFNQYLKKHYKENKAAYIAKGGKRRASLVSCTPKWADLKAIKGIYLMAEKISKFTGIKHHVDHVIPLQGRNVCGLHVECNLQIIPAKQNLSKANKLEG